TFAVRWAGPRPAHGRPRRPHRFQHAKHRSAGAWSVTCRTSMRGCSELTDAPDRPPLPAAPGGAGLVSGARAGLGRARRWRSFGDMARSRTPWVATESKRIATGGAKPAIRLHG